MRERWRRLSSAQQGFVWSLLLLAVWIGYWFVVNPGSQGSEPNYLDTSQAEADQAFEDFRPIIIWVGGALLVFTFMGVWSFVHLMRDRGVRFEDLDPEEQHRRERAGDLLRGLGGPEHAADDTD